MRAHRAASPLPASARFVPVCASISNRASAVATSSRASNSFADKYRRMFSLIVRTSVRGKLDALRKPVRHASSPRSLSWLAEFILKDRVSRNARGDRLQQRRECLSRQYRRSETEPASLRAGFAGLGRHLGIRSRSGLFRRPTALAGGFTTFGDGATAGRDALSSALDL